MVIERVSSPISFDETVDLNLDRSKNLTVAHAHFLSTAAAGFHHLVARGSAPHLSASDNPWPTVNWPDDGDPSDPAFNFNPDIYNPDGTLRPLVDPFGGHGILQDLFGMIHSLKQYSGNSGILWPKLVMLIGNIASNPDLANNPQIQSVLGNGFIQSTTGNSFMSQVVNLLVMQAWGNVLANGGTLDQANTAGLAFAMQLKDQFDAMGLTDQDPIAGSMVSQIDLILADGGNKYFQDLTHNYSYTDPATGRTILFYRLPTQPADSIFYCCPTGWNSDGHGAAGWMQVLNGLAGQYLSGGLPGTQANDPININDIINAAFVAQFVELIQKIKDPTLLLILLFIMLGMGKDGAYQTQLGGLGMSTDFLSKGTNDVASLITQLTTGGFTKDSAHLWVQHLMDILADATNKSSYTDSSFYKTLSDTINGILDAPVSGQSTIRQAFDNNGDASAVLNTIGADTTSSVFDFFNTLSKTMTDRSQTIGTLTSGVTQKDNQVVNVMNTGLNDSSSGFVAQESTAVKNQIP
ncbi:MAG: hypothetical protein JSS32_08110 [Verrucomicrobia bacterium]|nr:hypothetical protein [Verrucomicrobiota bacterium]